MESIASCEATLGFVSNNDDCNDEDWMIHPDANEICDFIDNDCDTLIDDDDNDIDIFTHVFFYIDDDGDSYGDGSLGFGCESSALGALVSGDCDDSDPFTHPQQVEYVDDIDHNVRWGFSLHQCCFDRNSVLSGMCLLLPLVVVWMRRI